MIKRRRNRHFNDQSSEVSDGFGRRVRGSSWKGRAEVAAGPFPGRLLCLAVFLPGLITGCRWEVPRDAEEESAREGVVASLQGSWSTLCLFGEIPGGEADAWARVGYRFEGSAVTRTDLEYADSGCEDADVVVEFRGEFDVGRELSAEDGQQVHELDFEYSDIDLTVGDTEVPPTPLREYDILSFRPDASGFFLGEKDDAYDSSERETRPVVVDFSTEYREQ